MKRRTFLATALGAIGSSVACAWSAGGRLHTGTALAFGTIINIAVVHADEKLARRAINAALGATRHGDHPQRSRAGLCGRCGVGGRVRTWYRARVARYGRIRRPWPQARPALDAGRAPRDPQALAATLRLDGRAMATSGDYEMAFTPDYLHHHIFDPKAGCSPPQLASVTLLAHSAMLADGLSTACMVLGADKAMALAARLPGVDLLAIDKAGRAWRSAGFPPEAA